MPGELWNIPIQLAGNNRRNSQSWEARRETPPTRRGQGVPRAEQPRLGLAYQLYTLPARHPRRRPACHCYPRPPPRASRVKLFAGFHRHGPVTPGCSYWSTAEPQLGLCKCGQTLYDIVVEGTGRAAHAPCPAARHAK